MTLAHDSKRGWQHLLAFLQTDRRSAAFRRKHGRHASHASALVNGHAATILANFEEAMSHHSLWRTLVADLERDRGAGDSKDYEQLVVETAITLSLCGHGEFRWRVLDKLTSWPFRLLALGNEEPRHVRAAAARDLLDSVDLDPTTSKCRKSHLLELKSVVLSNGEALPFFWVLPFTRYDPSSSLTRKRSNRRTNLSRGRWNERQASPWTHYRAASHSRTLYAPRALAMTSCRGTCC